MTFNKIMAVVAGVLIAATVYSAASASINLNNHATGPIMTTEQLQPADKIIHTPLPIQSNYDSHNLQPAGGQD